MGSEGQFGGLEYDRVRQSATECDRVRQNEAVNDQGARDFPGPSACCWHCLILSYSVGLCRTPRYFLVALSSTTDSAKRMTHQHRAHHAPLAHGVDDGQLEVGEIRAEEHAPAGEGHKRDRHTPVSLEPLAGAGQRDREQQDVVRDAPERDRLAEEDRPRTGVDLLATADLAAERADHAQLVQPQVHRGKQPDEGHRGDDHATCHLAPLADVSALPSLDQSRRPALDLVVGKLPAYFCRR